MKRKTNIAQATNYEEEILYEEDICPQKPQIKSVTLFIACHLFGINALFVSENKLKRMIVQNLEKIFPSFFFE
jgi:hypothetical protein